MIINIDGVWVRVSDMYMRDSLVWRGIKEGWVKVDGQWERFFPVIPITPGTPFGGGFYAGRITQDDGAYALIIADKEAEQSLKWDTKEYNPNRPSFPPPRPGTDNNYDGLANSMAADVAQLEAIYYCRRYSGGGHTDWYLGSPLEMEVCYRNLKPTTTDNNTSEGRNNKSIPPGGTYTAKNPPRTNHPLFRGGGSGETGPQAFGTGWYWTSKYSYEVKGITPTAEAHKVRFSDGTTAPHDGRRAALDARELYKNYLVRPIRRVKIV